ncbi:hypothetical protein AB0H36_11615 [Kribbella sp. NPDC050820]|uniref:hypothetical protein n=1 Tax=Kribbella sp. NPDC050820 TaxID=3155408 RepID=UPI0033D53103
MASWQPAFDLRADHEAQFMQAAAAGAVSTLLGSAVVVREVWPAEVAVDPFLYRAVAPQKRSVTRQFRCTA